MGTERSRKKKSRRNAGKPASKLPQLLPGMPALDNVKKTVDFVSPQGDKYTILETIERNYDPRPAAVKKRRTPRMQ